MRGMSQELFIALIFGALFLARLLYSQLREKAATMQAETESGTGIQAPPLPWKADAITIQADTADAPEPVKALQGGKAAVAARAMSSAPHPPRRFSRAGLMPDRRAAQDAIVIAAILQPCHAHRPHDVG